MGEIIRDWLRTRLGVIIDLSPEIFGHYARDGTLLAKVLHSYDVINDSQLSTLLETQDPALARVNLKHLRVWLRFVGVDCDSDCIEDISNGKGTMSLRLFYKVFLCLENKDRLHFITLQKEREKYIPSSSKFDVTTVSEEPETRDSEDHPGAASLIINRSLVDWERKKYKQLIDGCKREGEKFRASQKEEEEEEEEKEKIGESTSGRKKKMLATTTGGRFDSLTKGAEKREMDEFARKHRVKKSGEPLDPCQDIVKHGSRRSKTPIRIDHEAARAYTKSLKSKHRQEALTKSFKTRLQKNLLNELWKKVLDDQEMEFDEIVAKKVLHQSQYEKQLVRKLCDIRSQKTRIAGNRRIVEELAEKTRENEMRLEDDRAREVMVRESEEVEAETRRIKELERRIEEQSRLRRDEKVCKFGEKMARDLVDISIKAGEYKIQSNEDQVPNSLWNQWKALFFKSQPIIEAAEHDIIARDDDLGDEKAWVIDEIEEEDETRTQVLNDENFEDYQNIKSPWKDFIPNLDDQVREYLNLGLDVLGYIVHKTLEYPRRRTESVEPPLPVMRTRAVVLGVPDSLLYEPIQELLKNKKIHLVRIEEAINYCLGRYKAEMKDVEYIDLGIIAATREILNPPSIPPESGEREKKVRKTDKSPSGKPKTGGGSVKRIELAKSRVDKVTQTPRVIPHEDMDPSLSDAAYIGKWIHEFLTLGEPLSDELNSRIIVEYLKSLEEIRGFVIVNYPNTCRQMNSLEFALTGRRLPINHDKLLTGIENTSIEETDSIPSSRIIYDEEENNDTEQDLLRQSRLVPNPIKPQYRRLDGRNSYFTAFVRIKPMDSRRDEKEKDDIWEIISDDATSLDAFYADQEIASILYYTIFDLSTLKRLVRLLIAGINESISRASSRELFGEYLDYFEGRRDDDYSASKAPMVKKLLRSRASDWSFGESKFSESIETMGEETKAQVSLGRWKDGPALPGEAEWSWANLPLPAQLLNSLAKIWQNLETCYVENLRQVFHSRRMIFDAIVPYKDFVTRHMREFIDRPDKKQDFLHEFHRAFNLIDQDIRDDAEVKGELHCRIDDFQTKLWEICDSRRRDAEDERERIIMDHWTTVEMINIANLYIDILQAEIDRCNDTLQFVQDYYTSMLQGPLEEIRSRVSLKKIPLKSSTTGSSVFSTGNGSTRSVREKELKQVRGKMSISKMPPDQSPPDNNLFEEETRKLLTDVDRENVVPSQALCYTEANIKYIEGIIESLASRVLDNLKKEESNVSKSPLELRDKKKGSSRRVSRSDKTEQESYNKRAQSVILEWRYALMFEINRIRVRLKILDGAARSDINYLIDGMRGTFLGVKKNLMDRYEREIKSVNEMASSFRFAVEEAKPIQEEMLLDADSFLVRSNVLMFPDKLDISHSPVKENIISSRFTISQLARLVDIFRRSAPTGIISERSFVYILEDLIVCDDDKSESSPLPPQWFELRACDVTKLVNELFGDVEFVDWREFIIYAMDIDMPSVDEILENFRAFGIIDDKSEEFLSRDEFFSTRLWFDDGNVRRNLSSPDSGEHFLRQEIYDKSSSVAELRKNSNIAGARDVEPAEGETLRLELAKKLLSDMFLSNCQRVNCIALFMAFCKDDKPEIGLGKALSLAIGNKICMNWRDGEDYVRQRIEEKRLAADARFSESNLREEATKASEGILNRLLKGVVRSSRVKIQETAKNVTMNERKADVIHTTPIRIEKLDVPGEFIDPAYLLRAENKSWISDPSEETASAETPEERKNRGLSVTISLPGGENEMKSRSTVYWLDFDVCQSILAAMLPIHATQPSILESGKSLRENLQIVYLDLRDETINDEAGVILAHRFIHHNFINKLLADTSKFTNKYLGNILDNIIRDNQ